MATTPSFDDKLARLSELARRGVSDELVTEIRRLLAGSSAYAASRAAKVAGEFGLKDLAPAVAEAFGRVLSKPASQDKGCIAKTTLVEALDALGYADAEVFVNGARHVQIEPVFGGQVDTAAPLRTRCATALVRAGRTAEILPVLADLLVDPEPGPRIVAAKNLGFGVVSEASELLLRLKARAGDANPEVLECCFGGLLNLVPARYFDFVAGYLVGTDLDVAFAAAMALGALRDKERASAILLNAWEKNIDVNFREAILAPIAMTRSKDAFDLLLRLIEDGSNRQASTAVQAFSCFAATTGQLEQIHQVVIGRKNSALTEDYRRVFESGSATSAQKSVK